MQIIGFAFVLAGTCVYNKIIQVPGFAYPAEEEDKQKLLEQPVSSHNGEVLSGLWLCVSRACSVTERSLVYLVSCSRSTSKASAGRCSISFQSCC